MMRLVHITASLGIGGAESVLSTLVDELQNKEVVQSVLSFRDGPYAAKIRASGVNVFIIKGLICQYDPIFWWRLYRCIKQLHPDCIHSLLWASNIAARFLGKMLGIPVVSGMHNSIVLYSRLCNIVDRITLPMAQRVVVIHEGVQESLYTRSAKHRFLPVRVIHNCIAIDQVLRLAGDDPHGRSEFGFSEDNFVIGAVGRWIPIKRYDLLIEQFALVYSQHPRARLMLVGYGPEEVRLRRLVEHLQLEHVVAFVVGKQAYGYFTLFDCFVLPSLTEGPAIALLEAMSLALPCVVTHDTATHPVITDRVNGLLLPANSGAVLQGALILLLENKRLAQQLGNSAKKTVQSNFSAVIMAKRYYEVFVDTVEEYQAVQT